MLVPAVANKELCFLGKSTYLTSFKGLNTKSWLARVPGNTMLGAAYLQPVSNLKVPGDRFCIIYLTVVQNKRDIKDTFLITTVFGY